ncbi:MAG TPA: uracil-DNA glycosylase family protein [Jatrophihabitans sp.]|nr:uracil-DNA glycosylase family protein [Jatrophihabitans sp.]
MTISRGDLWEYDPGPHKTSGWPELFAATPNYRGLGIAVTGGEAFRWHFGPMFYRGRLDGSARVLVIGQEGAQDESLSHRSFTGGTGARMQHLLNHVGIARSYLFLNTFVYPIFGQYDDTLRGLAQNPISPIVVHRHRMFDKVADGDLRLVIAVGEAAKESVTTWIAAHGGTADPAHLEAASCGGLLSGVRFLGVLHPGGITGGGETAIKADFVRAVNQIKSWVDADAGWLPADTGATRDLTLPFLYASDPAPYRDFAFGTCPRLGRGATSSNRGDGQRSIQLFSARGSYNAEGASLTYDDTAVGSADGYTDDSGDIPVEPPRHFSHHYDFGPSSTYARLLMGGQTGLAWPDFSALGVTSDASFGTGAIYRGRFTSVSLGILADPDTQDDLLTGRALCGESGQRLQALLTAAGLTTRYLIMRTLPVDVSDLSATQRDALVDNAAVQALHREVLRRVAAANSGLAALLTVGPGAARLAAHVAPTGLQVISLPAWSEAARGAWQSGLDTLSGLTYRKDLSTATFQLPAGRGRIPPADLPIGTPLWVGTSGNRASRPIDQDTHHRSPDYMKLYLPMWVNDLDAPPLSAADAALVSKLQT